jgi:hypothetical protein
MKVNHVYVCLVAVLLAYELSRQHPKTTEKLKTVISTVSSNGFITQDDSNGTITINGV